MGGLIARRGLLRSMAFAPALLWAPLRAQAPASPPRLFESRHVVTIKGARIAYRVVAGETDIGDAAGATGSIFSFSYLREGVDDPDRRPVLFVFNGGPGSSSVWLHLGVMGPRLVRLDRDVDPSVLPPFNLMDNGDCLLDIADLVFVDPVGTGFSRIVGAGKPADFYGIDEDARAMAQFVDRWLTYHDRWQSPKYVMGESYGTVRAAVLQRMLMGGPDYGGTLHAISLNGVILIGSVMRDMRVADAADDATMLIPSMAATAWYHGRIARERGPLDRLVDDAAAFAEGPYLQALRMGTRMPVEERTRIAQTLADFTGLPLATVLREDLRITAALFLGALLEDRGLDVGMYDSRYTLPRAPAAIRLDPVGDDPAMARYTPGFTAAWHRYMARELGIRMDRSYAEIQWTDLTKSWRLDRDGVAPGQSYAVDLALGMRRNPQLRVLVASGYYDLATPMMAAQTALARAGAPPDRLRFRRYEAGHMAYFGGTGAAFLADVRAHVLGR